MAEDDTSARAVKLRRVADFERSLRPTPVTSVLRKIGQTRAFASIYRRFGPRVDPWLIRRTQGRITTRFLGLPALLLTTTGARTGLQRVMPLIYLRHGDDFAVVGTNFGQLHHPGWTANLLADPNAAIEVGPERLDVRAELVDEETWHRLWPSFVAIYPGYDEYRSRAGDRTPRMFVLRPV
jgi:deazaflavin-dependent oxidoreductase (nitroreductase family)